MYIEHPVKFETYGAVKIYELSRVLALLGTRGGRRPGPFGINDVEDLVKVAESTAIVVPTRDEDPSVLDGVLRAIPTYSPVILVSASSLKPLNLYGIEVDIAKALYEGTGRTIVVVHQRDPLMAELLREALPNIIDEDGLVRYGKGEGMLIATLLADGIGAKNVGFIDADNYVPASALEYSLIYYTMLLVKGSRYRMIRISWGYKAHDGPELYLRRSGRVSSIVNSILNKALSAKRKRETDIIKTANSGEHAMTMELAKSLTYATSYAVETQELVSILENCYLELEREVCPSLPESVEVYQVESRTPHIHSEKGEAHIAGMLFESLSVIYHSKLAEGALRSQILNVIREVGYEVEPPPPQRYKYPSINAKALLDSLLAESEYSVAYGL